MKNNRLVKYKYSPDTMQDLKQTDLVKLSRDLLGSVVESTGLLHKQKMTPQKLQEAKMIWDI